MAAMLPLLPAMTSLAAPVMSLVLAATVLMSWRATLALSTVASTLARRASKRSRMAGVFLLMDSVMLARLLRVARKAEGVSPGEPRGAARASAARSVTGWYFFMAGRPGGERRVARAA